MRSMRVAMISVHACPIASEEGKETGGLNVYVLELSKALAKRGIILDLYTRSQNSNEPKIKRVAHNVRVIHLPAGPEKPYPKQEVLHHIPTFVSHLANFIKAESLRYDILHAHYYLSGVAAGELKKRLKLPTPLVMTFHTLGHMKNLVARSQDEWEKDSRIKAEKMLISRSAAIVATSHNDREFLMYLYNCPDNRISVITPGVDTELFRPIDQQLAKKIIGATSDHHVILSVGRIDPVKGFDVLLYALKILVARRPALRGKACVWIIGGDTSQPQTLWSHELKELEKMKRQLGLISVVKFVGQQPQNNLPAYYSAADVVVMPSHYESFGMVALEAMACGTPVVASDVSGISRIIGEDFSQFITTANNPLLLASQIDALIAQLNRLLSLQKKFRHLTLAFDWSNIAKRTERLYQRVL